MKYIRTKDGIYERVMVVRQVCNGNEVAVIRPDKVEFEPIINQADTIEELCDEFVDIYKYEKPDIALLNDIKFFESYKSHTVYGAIWTDKGLIYVAKMNEKGELELL